MSLFVQRTLLSTRALLVTNPRVLTVPQFLVARLSNLEVATGSHPPRLSINAVR